MKLEPSLWVFTRRRDVEPPREPLLQHLELRGERGEHPPPVDASAACALDEERGRPGEDVRRRPVCRDEEVLCFKLPARLRGIRRPPLVVDQLRDRIGEPRRGVGHRGTPDRVDMEHPIVRERQERVVHVARKGVELLRRRRGEVGPVVAPAGEERAVLLEHDAVVHHKGPVDEVREARGRDAVLPHVRQPAHARDAAQGSKGEGDKIHLKLLAESRGEPAAARRAHWRAQDRSPGHRGSGRRDRSSVDPASPPTP